jgi:hypothetical protein
MLAQIDVGDSLDRAWDSVIEIVPKIVLFLIILLVGFLVAKALSNLLNRILEKIGFDRWVERGGIKRALANTPWDASDMLAKLVYYALVLLTLQLAFGVFGENPISELIEGIVAYLPNIFVAILIIVIASYLATAARDLAGSALSSTQYGSALATGAYVAVLLTGVFAALDQLEIAPDIVNGIFYALLAIVAGSLIIAIGGGGIAPMRQRWETWLHKAQAEAARIDTGAARGATPPPTPAETGTEELWEEPPPST